MTRNPSYHPAVPVAPTGGSRPHARLLVIPDFSASSATTEAAKVRSEPVAEPSPPPAVVAELTPVNWAPEPIETTLPTDGFAVPCDALPIGDLTSLPDVAAVLASGRKISSDSETTHSVAASGSRTSETWLNRAGEQVMRLTAAAQPMRRLVENLPKRSTLGWQRTILLVVGGALLAAVTGSWRGDTHKHAMTSGRQKQGRPAPADTQIHRMTRAPLRAETANSTAAADVRTGAAETSSGDPIFRMPAIGPRHTVPDQGAGDHRPAARPTASEPAGEFPSIAAPDGSAVSRSDRARRDGRGIQSETMGPADPAAAEPWPRETLAESHLIQRGRSGPRPAATQATPVPSYPHTDPTKYREPYYEVPAIAERGHDTSR